MSACAWESCLNGDNVVAFFFTLWVKTYISFIHKHEHLTEFTGIKKINILKFCIEPPIWGTTSNSINIYIKLNIVFPASQHLIAQFTLWSLIMVTVYMTVYD